MVTRHCGEDIKLAERTYRKPHDTDSQAACMMSKECAAIDA